MKILTVSIRRHSMVLFKLCKITTIGLDNCTIVNKMKYVYICIDNKCYKKKINKKNGSILLGIERNIKIMK